jgi:intracellular sulfur oxidation DsrE/DsrF family protein
MDTPRRDFFQQILAAGALTTGAGLLSACATASASGAAPGAVQPTSSTGAWDMSWTQRLGKFKTAYDSPEIMGGAALHYASAATSGYREIGAAERDVTPVLILRHAASVMVLNDAMWELLEIGKSRTIKGADGEPAKKNPFINFVKGEKNNYITEDTAVDALMKRGAIVLACNNALRGSAYQLRQKQPNLTSEAALAEIRRNVIPGAIVMPNGIFAVAAAQDAGCNYMRVAV